MKKKSKTSDNDTRPDKFAGQDRPYSLNQLNVGGVPPLINNKTTVEQWRAKRAKIESIWLDCIGGIPDRTPVNCKFGQEFDEKNHIRRHLIYDTFDGDKVTAYLLIPKVCLDKQNSARRPAVLALHPTNEFGKDCVAFKNGKKNRTYAYELAERGYVVLAPDAMTAGERIFEGTRCFHSAPFYKKYPDWSTAGKNITDHIQGVDLLTTLEYVDAEAIGAIGHSFGGYNAFFLSSLDKRIKAVVCSCGVSPFAGNSDPGHWGERDWWYGHIPKISAYLNKGVVPFEFNEIMALTEPRPFFNNSAQGDHIFPHWQAVGDCSLDVYKLYEWMGMAEKFQSVIIPGDHDFPPAIRLMSYSFLDQYLMNSDILKKISGSKD